MITNNGAERAVRTIAVGRKDGLVFLCCSDDHAAAAANLFSLVAWCKRHRLVVPTGRRIDTSSSPRSTGLPPAPASTRWSSSNFELGHWASTRGRGLARKHMASCIELYRCSLTCWPPEAQAGSNETRTAIADDTLDLALVFLDPRALNGEVGKNGVVGSTWERILKTDSRRPSFQANYVSTDPNRGVAGWGSYGDGSPANWERSMLLGANTSPSGLQTHDGTAQYGLFMEPYQSSHYPDDPKLVGGDSGGPLFLVQSDGFRDLKGVHRGIWYTNASNEYIWVDVTEPENVAWIKATARDPEHDLQPTWLAKHAIPLISGQADYWFGEVEYRGDCDRLHDTDCDHWRDSKDNCPNTWNPDQTASYDGAFGDACTGLGDCPCDPDQDQDHDQICAYACPSTETTTGSRWDNCPTVWNRFQENTNVEFERASAARGADVGELGDVCDPVPTPVPEPLTRFDSLICKQIGGDTFPSVDLGQVCGASVVQDHIATTGIAPHAVTTGVAVPVSLKGTKPRFCQDDPAAIAPINCHDAQVLRDAQLTVWANDDAEQGDDPARPWHRITIGAGLIGFRDVPLPSINFGSGVAVSTKWFFDRDIDYWATGLHAPKVTGPFMGNCPLYDCLDGTLWMHTPTLIGSDANNASLNGINIGFHGKDLANGLTSILPKVSNVTWCVPPLIPKVPALALASVQGAPSSSEMPLSPLLWPSTGTLRFADQRGVNDTQLLVPSGGDMMAALMDDGSLLAVHDLPNGSGGAVNCGGNKVNDTVNSVAFGPSGGRWLGAIEASRFIGGSDAMAIAFDGTHLVAQATASGDSFAGTLIDPASGGSVTDVVGPSPRSGFLSFYSRSLGGVFVAAGTANGTVQHDIWLKRLDEAWHNVTPNAPANVAPLGDIVAATFSLRDRSLWILDERNVGPVRVTRLVRSLLAGTFEVLGSWPGRGKIDRKLLTLDREGNVLVTLARSTGPGFVTARVEEIAGELRVTATYKVPGARLLAAPIATPKGYIFVVEKNGKQRIQRTTDLNPRAPCDLDDDLDDEGK